MAQSITFDIEEIANACKHLDLQMNWDIWFECTPGVVYIRFVRNKHELANLLRAGKAECIDFEDEHSNWQALAEAETIPDLDLLSCRYIFCTT
jgi:hypothetical protein